MNKLYNCNAKIDNSGLISYQTRIVTINNDSILLNPVYTSTTLSHIRKYYKWLNNHNEKELSNTIEAMYHIAITHKATQVEYDKTTGEIKVR